LAASLLQPFSAALTARLRVRYWVDSRRVNEKPTGQLLTDFVAEVH
jgi:hypothetical protein